MAFAQELVFISRPFVPPGRDSLKHAKDAKESYDYDLTIQLLIFFADFAFFA